MKKTDDEKTSGEKGDYAVGYGRPPVHSRFRPGQSGNPKGRPKGSRNFATDVTAMLDAPITITGKDGRRRTVTTQAAAMLRLKEKAMKGDYKAIGMILQLAREHNGGTADAAVPDLPDDAQAILDGYLARRLRGSGEVALVGDGAAGTATEEDDDDWLR